MKTLFFVFFCFSLFVFVHCEPVGDHHSDLPDWASQRIIANDDHFEWFPNTEFRAGGILANDISSSDLIVMTTALSFPVETSLGGKIHYMHPRGDFVYRPPVGKKGETDTFQYPVTNGRVTTTANVHIRLHHEAIWWVDGRQTPAGRGEGTSWNPFGSIHDAGDCQNDLSYSCQGGSVRSQIGDWIRVKSHSALYDTGIVLKERQRLVCGSVPLVIDSRVVDPAGAEGSNSHIGSPGHGIVVNERNHIQGCHIRATGSSNNCPEPLLHSDACPNTRKCSALFGQDIRNPPRLTSTTFGDNPDANLISLHNCHGHWNIPSTATIGQVGGVVFTVSGGSATLRIRAAQIDLSGGESDGFVRIHNQDSGAFILDPIQTWQLPTNFRSFFYEFIGNVESNYDIGRTPNVGQEINLSADDGACYAFRFSSNTHSSFSLQSSPLDVLTINAINDVTQALWIDANDDGDAYQPDDCGRASSIQFEHGLIFNDFVSGGLIQSNTDTLINFAQDVEFNVKGNGLSVIESKGSSVCVGVCFNGLVEINSDSENDVGLHIADNQQTILFNKDVSVVMSPSAASTNLHGVVVEGNIDFTQSLVWYMIDFRAALHVEAPEASFPIQGNGIHIVNNQAQIAFNIISVTRVDNHGIFFNDNQHYLNFQGSIDVQSVGVDGISSSADLASISNVLPGSSVRIRPHVIRFSGDHVHVSQAGQDCIDFTTVQGVEMDVNTIELTDCGQSGMFLESNAGPLLFSGSTLNIIDASQVQTSHGIFINEQEFNAGQFTFDTAVVLNGGPTAANGVHVGTLNSELTFLNDVHIQEYLENGLHFETIDAPVTFSGSLVRLEQIGHNGMFLDGGSGSLTLSTERIEISNFGFEGSDEHSGIYLIDTTSIDPFQVNFDSEIDIELGNNGASTNHGIYLSNVNVQFTHHVSINQVSGHGLWAKNNANGSIAFADTQSTLSVIDVAMSGVFLDHVDGTLLFDHEIYVEMAQEYGIEVDNNIVPLPFNSPIEIHDVSLDGLHIVQNQNTLTFSGQLTIDDVGQNGIYLAESGSTITINQPVDVSNTGGNGIHLNKVAGTVLMENDVSIVSAGLNGILLEDVDGSIELGQALTIDQVGKSGIRMNDDTSDGSLTHSNTGHLCSITNFGLSDDSTEAGLWLHSQFTTDRFYVALGCTLNIGSGDGSGFGYGIYLNDLGTDDGQDGGVFSGPVSVTNVRESGVYLEGSHGAYEFVEGLVIDGAGKNGFEMNRVKTSISVAGGSDPTLAITNSGWSGVAVKDDIISSGQFAIGGDLLIDGFGSANDNPATYFGGFAASGEGNFAFSVDGSTTIQNGENGYRGIVLDDVYFDGIYLPGDAAHFIGDATVTDVDGGCMLLNNMQDHVKFDNDLTFTNCNGDGVTFESNAGSNIFVGDLIVDGIFQQTNVDNAINFSTISGTQPGLNIAQSVFGPNVNVALYVNDEIDFRADIGVQTWNVVDTMHVGASVTTPSGNLALFGTDPSSSSVTESGSVDPWIFAAQIDIRDMDWTVGLANQQVFFADTLVLHNLNAPTFNPQLAAANFDAITITSSRLDRFSIGTVSQSSGGQVSIWNNVFSGTPLIDTATLTGCSLIACPSVLDGNGSENRDPDGDLIQIEVNVGGSGNIAYEPTANSQFTVLSVVGIVASDICSNLP